VIVTKTSKELDVEERYITCFIEEAGRRLVETRRLLAVSYTANIGVSIAETNEMLPKSVIEALSQTIEESPELENLGVRAEIVAYTEEGEEQQYISAGYKVVPSFVAVFCALALVLNQ